MMYVINSINVNIVKIIPGRFGVLHRFKTRATSAPNPSLRNLKRNLLINAFLTPIGKPLIIRVIRTLVDDRFSLVTFYFSLLDEFFFLRSNPFQQHRGGFVTFILLDEFSLYCPLED